jgi:hypothetical protein
MCLQETMYADVFQDVGGRLTPEEAAAVARWRAATGGAAAQQAAAAAAEPWVTEQQLRETGMLNDPYYVQVWNAAVHNYLHHSAAPGGAVRLRRLDLLVIKGSGRGRAAAGCNAELICVHGVTAAGCLPQPSVSTCMYKHAPTASCWWWCSVSHMTYSCTHNCIVLLGATLRTQVKLGGTEYGRYGRRIQKQMTKAFFPRIHEALKPVADADVGRFRHEIDRDGE